jgi:hypothetical protein
MDGERLFEAYRASLAAQGVGMDGWETLEETDRRAWTLLADSLFGTPIARITDQNWSDRLATIEFIWNPLPPGTELFQLPQ